MQPLPRLRLLVTAAAALVCSASLAVSASATSLTVASMGWSISDTGQGGAANMLNVATCNSTDVGGDCTLTSWTPGHGLYRVNSWSSSWETDPFVTNNFNVTNTSPNVMTFDVQVTSPVILTGPQTAMSGSLGITLTNTAGTAQLDDAGTPVYQALIDGVLVRSLLNSPYSAYVLSCAAVACSATDSAEFGIFPTPPESGPQANTSIAIRIRFDLTPGDSAGITSVFNIEAVPEPGAAALVGLGLLGLAVAGRRRA